MLILVEGGGGQMVDLSSGVGTLSVFIYSINKVYASP